MIGQYGHERYATGILASLDTRTGLMTWINHGHHRPLLMQRGRRRSHLACPPAHPLGTDLGGPAVPCREQLEPGDRIVLCTDGITEARDAGGVSGSAPGRPRPTRRQPWPACRPTSPSARTRSHSPTTSRPGGRRRGGVYGARGSLPSSVT
ncbi:PP2C family protein-serine/threonine phosphatase [Streptomyces parvus]